MKNEKINNILYMIDAVLSTIIDTILSGCFFYIAFRMEEVSDIKYIIPAIIFIVLDIFNIKLFIKNYREYKSNKKEGE